MSNAASLKKQLSETFAQQLVMPPALDQVDPDFLAKAIKNEAPGLRVVDVRQAEEFKAGHVKGAVSMPMDSFDPAGLISAIAEEHAAGKADKPLVVFCSSQSPDIDANCALTFVSAWEEAGLDKKTGIAGASIAVTLLGGVVFWLQQNKDDAALTEAYDAATWGTVLQQTAASPATDEA